MLIVPNRKIRKERKDRKAKAKARRRVMRSVRRVLLALILGLLGFFVYTNVDYFLTVADRFEGGEEETVAEKDKPGRFENLFASAKAKNALSADSASPPPERRSVNEILGEPIFSDGSMLSDGDMSLLTHMSSVLRQMDTAREPVQIVQTHGVSVLTVRDEVDEDGAGTDEVNGDDDFGADVDNGVMEVADAIVDTVVDNGINADVVASVDTVINTDINTVINAETIADTGTGVDTDNDDFGIDVAIIDATDHADDDDASVDPDSAVGIDFHDIGETFGTSVKKAVNKVVSTIVDTWDAVSVAAIETVNSAVSTIVDTWDVGSVAVIETVNSAFSTIVDTWDVGSVAVIETVNAIVSTIVDTVADIMPSSAPVPQAVSVAAADIDSAVVTADSAIYEQSVATVDVDAADYAPTVAIVAVDTADYAPPVAVVAVDTADYAPTVAVVAVDTVDYAPTVAKEVAVANVDTVPAVTELPEPVVMGRFMLADIACRLADRDDLLISVSVELFYDSAVLRDEVKFKHGTLTAIVGNVVRSYEYGDVVLSSLRADLLDSFNRVLREGALTNVDIQNFRVEQVALNN